MKQMELPDDMKEQIDFDDLELPLNARVLRPLVYKDEGSFCVVLGPNPQDGVFGCGNSIKEALMDWDVHLKQLLSENRKDDFSEFLKSRLRSAI